MTSRFGGVTIEVAVGDITKLASTPSSTRQHLAPRGGGDGAIHRAAGPDLAIDARMLKGYKTGAAKITKGFKLPARYVIHASPGVERRRQR